MRAAGASKGRAHRNADVPLAGYRGLQDCRTGSLEHPANGRQELCPSVQRTPWQQYARRAEGAPTIINPLLPDRDVVAGLETRTGDGTRKSREWSGDQAVVGIKKFKANVCVVSDDEVTTLWNVRHGTHSVAQRLHVCASKNTVYVVRQSWAPSALCQFLTLVLGLSLQLERIEVDTSPPKRTINRDQQLASCTLRTSPSVVGSVADDRRIEEWRVAFG